MSKHIYLGWGRRRRPLLLVASAWAVTLPLISKATEPAPPEQASAEVQEMAQIATDAYVFGYPLVTMQMTKTVSTNVPRPMETRAPVGQLANARTYPTAAFQDVTAPNADTLHSVAWLDLSKGPIVFSYPNMGDRYFVFPMLDAYTNVIAVPGKRTTGGKAAIYVITGPDWQGRPPSGTTQVKSPTNMVWLLGRTYCTGTPEDYKAVHALQDQVRLYPLSAFGRPYTPPVGPVNPRINMKAAIRDQVDEMSGGQFFLLLSTLIKDNPATKADAPLIARMARLGFIVGQPFDAGKHSPTVSSAIAMAPKAGQARITAHLKQGTISVNGWVITTRTGNYGTDYDQRALVTAVGLGANLSKDAIYPVAETDGAGQKLSGTNRYVMHFGKGQLPPIKGFWSLTMYNPKLFFVANPLNRFTLSPRNDLARNADGSVDLFVQNDKPTGHESNWLPAPKSDFVLMLRLYWPSESKPSILDGSWKPPPVTPQSGAPRLGRESPRKRPAP